MGLVHSEATEQRVPPCLLAPPTCPHNFHLEKTLRHRVAEMGVKKVSIPSDGGPSPLQPDAVLKVLINNPLGLNKYEIERMYVVKTFFSEAVRLTRGPPRHDPSDFF